MRRSQLLSLYHLVCSFYRIFTCVCVCPSLDVLHNSIAQKDGFNNFNFMWEEYMINHGYTPWSYNWINEVIHCGHCWHCGAWGYHLEWWWSWKPSILPNSNFISSSYLPSQTTVQVKNLFKTLSDKLWFVFNEVHAFFFLVSIFDIRFW